MNQHDPLGRDQATCAGLRLPPLSVVAAVLIAAAGTLVGVGVAREYHARQGLADRLDSFAIAHPEHANAAGALAECTRKWTSTIEQCGEQLFAKKGNDALQLLVTMQREGVFGEEFDGQQ